ncbi:MAG: hypothetical protein JJE50_10705 [Actinomycetales bacterium]|nr:hypothetical protein [Actinomycetales bacterium]
MSLSATSSDPVARPLALRVALTVVLLEVGVLVAVGLWSLVQLVDGGFADVGVSVALTVVLFGIAGLVLLGTRALWSGRRWGRGPVVTWQLLQLAVAASALGGAPWWTTYLPMVLAVVVLAGLLLPASVAATSGTGSPDGVL